MRVARSAFRGSAFTRTAAIPKATRFVIDVGLALVSNYEAKSDRREAKSYRQEARSDRREAKSYRREARSDRPEAKSYRQDTRSDRWGAKSYRHEVKSIRHEGKSYRHETKSIGHEAKSYRDEGKSWGTAIGIKKAGATLRDDPAFYAMRGAAMLGGREGRLPHRS